MAKPKSLLDRVKDLFSEVQQPRVAPVRPQVAMPQRTPLQQFASSPIGRSIPTFQPMRIAQAAQPINYQTGKPYTVGEQAVQNYQPLPKKPVSRPLTREQKQAIQEQQEYMQKKAIYDKNKKAVQPIIDIGKKVPVPYKGYEAMDELKKGTFFSKDKYNKSQLKPWVDTVVDNVTHPVSAVKQFTLPNEDERTDNVARAFAKYPAFERAFEHAITAVPTSIGVAVLSQALPPEMKKKVQERYAQVDASKRDRPMIETMPVDMVLNLPFYMQFSKWLELPLESLFSKTPIAGALSKTVMGRAGRGLIGATLGELGSSAAIYGPAESSLTGRPLKETIPSNVMQGLAGRAIGGGLGIALGAGAELLGRSIAKSGIGDQIGNAIKNQDGFIKIPGGEDLASSPELGAAAKDLVASKLPKAGSVEQIAEQAMGFKPGMRKQFDMALFEKNFKKVNELLPQIPEAYKTRFVAEIQAIQPKGVRASFESGLEEGAASAKRKFQGGSFDPFAPIVNPFKKIKEDASLLITPKELEALRIFREGVTPEKVRAAGLTFGDMQNARSRLTNMDLLADFYNASKAKNWKLMRAIGEEIFALPKGTPYDAYKESIGRRVEAIFPKTRLGEGNIPAGVSNRLSGLGKGLSESQDSFGKAGSEGSSIYGFEPGAARSYDSFEQKSARVDMTPEQRGMSQVVNDMLQGKETQGASFTDVLFGRVPKIKSALDETVQSFKDNPQGGFVRIGGDTPKPKVVAPEAIGTEKVRGFIESIKQSKNTPQGVKDLVSGSYVPKSNKSLKADAISLIKAAPDAARELALNPRNATDIQIGNELIAYYGSIGDFAKAAEIGDGMARSGTEFGQAVQAFSQYDKTTPSGAVKYAQSKINAYNRSHPNKKINIKDSQVKALFDEARKIQEMEMGHDRVIAQHLLNEKVNSLIPSTIVDKFITVWKAGLLTSLRTHERNLLGNTIHQGAEIAKDAPASLADQLMSLKTGKRTTAFTISGLGKGGQKGLQAGKDIIQTGFDPNDSIGKYDIQRVTWGDSKLEQAMKKYTDVVFRTLGAEDKPFWNAAFARSLYDQAITDAMNIGRTGDMKYIKGLVDDPSEAFVQTATKDANTATFHDKNTISNVASAIKRQLGKTEVGKFISEVIAPFTGVPSSIAKQMINYSPVGLAKGAIETTRVLAGQVPDLQRQAAQDLGRGIIGSSLFGLGAYLTQQGLMTGNPQDPAEARQWELEGKQRNSVLVNGEWRSINSIGPEAIIMLAGSKAQQQLGETGEGFGAFLGDVGKDFTQQTFLKGVQDPLNAISDPGRYGENYLRSLAGSTVPNISKDTARAGDPYQRETNSIMDAFKYGIPGARNTLTERRDVLGNTLPNDVTGPQAFFDLFNSMKPRTSPVISELERLNEAGVNATPSELKKEQTIRGIKTTLTPQQLNLLEKEVGPVLRESLDRLISTPGYSNLTDEAKKKAIDGLVSDVRAQVRKTANISVMPDQGYETSADAPKDFFGKAGLYGNAIIKSPTDTIAAISSGNPLRKMRGDAVVLERQKGLGGLDFGDKSTQVDHIIPLSLGGSNNQSNLRNIPAGENKAKSYVEVYLLDLLESGKISKRQAQERVLNWQNELGNLPEGAQVAAMKAMNTPVEESQQTVPSAESMFTYFDTKGNEKTVDLNFWPEYPELTGSSQLDKKLISKYKGQVTQKKNDIIELYEQGQISAVEAEKMLNKLDNSSKGASGKGKKIKIARGKVSAAKFTPIKIAKSKAPTGNIKIKGLPNISNIELDYKPRRIVV